MKVCLINPPALFLENPKANPPLGLLYVAAALERAGHEVRVLDLAGERTFPPPLPEADVYGVGFTTPQYAEAKSLSYLLKGRSPAFLVAGGPHVTCMPRETLQETAFDSVVVGEGERAIVQLLEMEKPPSILASELIGDLDTIPFPARHLVDIYDYAPDIDRYDGSKTATTAISARGCPFNCAYCCKRMWGRNVRFRSPKNFVQEIEQVLEEYSITHFKFLDDTFTLDNKRLMEICELLKPLKVYWRCESRVDMVNYDALRLMYEGGCREIAFGIESGSQRVLDRINKGTTVEQNEKAVLNAKRAGLKVKAFLMVGSPGETEDTVEETIGFFKRVKPDKWMVNTFTPTVGSAIWDEPERFGCRILSRDFSKYYFIGRGAEAPVVVETEALKAEDIVRLREKLKGELEIYGSGVDDRGS